MITTELKAVARLCLLDDPYAHSSERDALFVAAMREVVAWHQAGSSFYAELLRRRGFSPSRVESIESCASIPMVPAGFFKANEVLSIARTKVFAHLTSSGTLGQKSQMFFDEWSLRTAQRMVDSIFALNGWVSEEPANYLLYTYETESDSRLGTAYTDGFLCKYAPIRSVELALKLDGKGGHEFDLLGCIRALQRFASEGAPVRIFGFPAFLQFTLERMRGLRLPPLRLSERSLVFLGGGWKGQADLAIPKSELYARVAEQLGIPDSRLRDGFGSVEHCIPYIECLRHRFHVPVWSRVFIRDVRTLEALGFDHPGFLQFVSPYITSVPAHSVMMGDLAVLKPGDACGCGIQSPYFEVLGRAGVSRNKSCAMAASELLKGAS